MEERLDLLEFQLELLFNNTELDRFLYESKVTRKQYKELMSLMLFMQDEITKGADVHHYAFEQRVYEIAPQLNGNYHFCEIFVKELAKEGAYEEVFAALYGEMPKYKGQE